MFTFIANYKTLYYSALSSKLFISFLMAINLVLCSIWTELETVQSSRVYDNMAHKPKRPIICFFFSPRRYNSRGNDFKTFTIINIFSKKETHVFYYRTIVVDRGYGVAGKF